MALAAFPTAFGKRHTGDRTERTLESGERSVHGTLFSLVGACE